MPRILTVDFGISWLGLAVLEIDEAFRNIQVLDLQLVNLVDLLNPAAHQTVPYEDCQLYHASHTCDRFRHLLQEYRSLFTQVDRIVLEMQPPNCVTIGLSDLMMNEFRALVSYIHPGALRTILGLPGDRQQRKQAVVAQMDARFQLHRFPAWHIADRRHDLADAVAVGVAWVQERQQGLPDNLEFTLPKGAPPPLLSFPEAQTRIIALLRVDPGCGPLELDPAKITQHANALLEITQGCGMTTPAVDNLARSTALLQRVKRVLRKNKQPYRSLKSGKLRLIPNGTATPVSRRRVVGGGRRGQKRQPDEDEGEDASHPALPSLPATRPET